MGELYAEQAESAPAEGRGAAASGRPGRRKAVAHEAHGPQTCAVTSAPAATPIAGMVEAMLCGAVAAGAPTVNQNSTLVEHYSEPNPSQNREVARAAASNAPGAP
jgi:hypothetical protein